MSDPHRALRRALVARCPELTVIRDSSEPWASVTFTGMRHLFCCAPGVDPARLAALDVELPGHILADISVRLLSDQIRIEALTIETGDWPPG